VDGEVEIVDLRHITPPRRRAPIKAELEIGEESSGLKISREGEDGFSLGLKIANKVATNLMEGEDLDDLDMTPVGGFKKKPR